ncbi:O-antigen/teichoic acid export membrane protein [Ureibacillus xyleni]|uniref:O-antigen/teichoic acid export membrane protein n=1 Tax=Ureibacillus xyleni TaxID=614648 RepID=A0A285STC8_9BACL|nr:hypothetical protein [Ureibacillus xyleni]SOC11314.1 O-antigen/teichoic acid export membrane protein [Ureibacillus xyleni]
MKELKGHLSFFKNQHSIYMIIDIFLNGIIFLLSFYMSWMFSQGEFGKLNALLSFLALTYVLGLSFQMYVTKVVQTNESNFVDILESAKKLVFLLLVPFLLVTPILSYFLKATPISVGIIGLITATSIFLCMERGIIQGQERFIHLSISLCIDIGIKSIVIVPLLLVTTSIPLVLLATLLGHLGAYIFCRIINRHHYNREKIFQTKFIVIYRSIWSIFTAQFFFYFFTSIDMVIVNHYLTEKAGIYAITIKLGQLYLTFGLALLFLWFPKMVREKGDRIKLKKSVIKCLTLVLFGGCLLSILYHIWVSKWIVFFFPTDYIEIQKYIGFSGLIYTFLLVSIILTHFFIAYDSKRYIKVFAFVAVFYLTLTSCFHDKLIHVMVVQLLTYLLMAMLLLYNFFNLSEKEGNLQ